MKNRAFTLIELLVVIAIIAILAAILFPVFAQAKLAAKKAASISNAKEIGLANIMYEGDFDDDFVIVSQDLTDDGCGFNGTCWNGLNAPSSDWPILLQPYIKSYGLYVDPGTGDPQGIFNGSGAAANKANWNVHAQYGYNYEFLAPLVILNVSALNGNPDLTSASIMSSLGRSSTAAVAPANTVMFTSAQNFATVTSGQVQFSTPDADLANAPGTMYWILPSPDRVVIVGNSCYSNLASFQWGCNWTKNTKLGPITADVRALNPYNNAVVTWVDGHTKAMTADALAAGTDYGTSTSSSNPDVYGPSGSIVTNISNYLWSLDGTLTDVK